MTPTIKTILASLVIGTATFAATPTALAEDATYTARFSNAAVGGYDAVSYFDGEGVEGSKDFATEYQGAEYRFVSQENLDRFAADPEAYAPQYGGYCAWAAAEGKLAPGNPEFAAIHDGKLYLNFNAGVQETWNADRGGFIERADATFPGLVD